MTQLTLFVQPAADDEAQDDTPSRYRRRQLDGFIICPGCELTWTIETPRSWWLKYDRCYSCMRHAAGTTGRVLDETEMRPFELAAVGERPGYAWRCLDCSWHSRSRGPLAHEHVRIHQTVTGHATSCRKVSA